jgi:hypothetical protein
MCKAHPHTKGSCYHCIVNGLPCLFPPNTILRHGSPRMTNAFRFQRNCVHCTRSHQKCVFDTDFPLQCKRCMKLEIPCLFQLSSQGRRNDLNASTDPKDTTTMLMKSAVIVCDGRSTTELDGAHSPPKPLDPNGRSVNANESAHYHHSSNGYSCHGREEPITILDLGVTSTDANESVHDSCHLRCQHDDTPSSPERQVRTPSSPARWAPTPSLPARRAISFVTSTTLAHHTLLAQTTFTSKPPATQSSPARWAPTPSLPAQRQFLIWRNLFDLELLFFVSSFFLHYF